MRGLIITLVFLSPVAVFASASPIPSPVAEGVEPLDLIVS